MTTPDRTEIAAYENTVEARDEKIADLLREVTAYSATVENMQREIDALKKANTDWFLRSTELAYERDNLKADAERYRFLRNTHSWETAIWQALDMAEGESYQIALDYAVDAAMKAAP